MEKHEHAQHAEMDPPTEHAAHNSGQAEHAMHGGEHAGGHEAHVDHTGHEMMFRQRFWISLVLTIPVLLFSPMSQEWFGFQMPQFTGSQFVGPFFAVVIFLYGGLPFLQMAVPEVRNRKPGMMLLISLAITVYRRLTLPWLSSSTGNARSSSSTNDRATSSGSSTFTARTVNPWSR